MCLTTEALSLAWASGVTAGAVALQCDSAVAEYNESIIVPRISDTATSTWDCNHIVFVSHILTLVACTVLGYVTMSPCEPQALASSLSRGKMNSTNRFEKFPRHERRTLYLTKSGLENCKYHPET